MTHFLSIKDKIFFSIIVPCYNAEKYIHKLIDSVIAQSISDWELILIDDGSKDNTAGICREAAKNDSRIRYIYQDNAGVSNARNHGLKEARGMYITCIDSDDWIEPNFLECFKNGHLADINICGYREIYTNGNIKGEWAPISLYSKQPLETYTVRNSFFRTPWAVLFRHDFLKAQKLSFMEKLSWGEDTVFLLQATIAAQDINFISDIIYNYRYTGEGLTNAPKRHYNMIQFLNIYTEIRRDVILKSSSAVKMMDELTLFLSMILLLEVIKSPKNKNEKLNFIRSIHHYIKKLPLIFILKTKVGRIRYAAAILSHIPSTLFAYQFYKKIV